MMRRDGMKVRFTDKEPVYGQRIKLPAWALARSCEIGKHELVHLASPMFDANTNAFLGKYACCMGVFEDHDLQNNMGDPSVYWEMFILPGVTVLTCLSCIRMEDIERGRRSNPR
jgi:hypothetical protein